MEDLSSASQDRPTDRALSSQEVAPAAGIVPAGTVPFVLRIGVAGHRFLDDPAKIANEVQQAILKISDDFIRMSPGTEVLLVAVSALQEGSDRLVPRAVLALPGGSLEVVLPLPPEAYIHDFMSDESRNEFRHLMAQASHVWQAPESASRDEAYERADRYVVNRCDVLVAVWDGLPARGRGGTAEIVAYARAQGVPLVWIHEVGDPAIEFETERMRNVLIEAQYLNQFNTGAVASSKFEVEMKRTLGLLGLGVAPKQPVENALRHACEPVALWLIPVFVRANLIAMRMRRQFQFLSTAMFVMAAAAVSVVAVQISFWPNQNWIAVFEVLLLLFMLSIPPVSDRLRLHERWRSHRYFAESLRSSYFVVLTGSGIEHLRLPSDLAPLPDPSAEWINRALDGMTARAPQIDAEALEVAVLRKYLNQYWINEYASYSAAAAKLQENWANSFRLATPILFIITLVAAILHFLDIGQYSSYLPLAALLIVLSICVPAIGNAVHGLAEQRDYGKRARQSHRIALLLKPMMRDMSEAKSLREVREVAARVEQIRREESNAWYGVMRSHHIKLAA